MSKKKYNYHEAHAQVERELRNARSSMQNYRLLDGEKLWNEKSCLAFHLGLFVGKSYRPAALGAVAYPRFPDHLGISDSGKYVITRKTVYTSNENAYHWLCQNFTIIKQIAANCVDQEIPAVTTTLFSSPRPEAPGERFIIGRKFDYVGTVYSQECLYHQEGSKRFSLEVTLFDKEIGTQELQGGEPHILQVTIPLSAKAADRWVCRTGAPDEGAERYVRDFRAAFTNLDPFGNFTLPEWRRRQTA